LGAAAAVGEEGRRAIVDARALRHACVHNLDWLQHTRRALIPVRVSQCLRTHHHHHQCARTPSSMQYTHAQTKAGLLTPAFVETAAGAAPSTRATSCAPTPARCSTASDRSTLLSMIPSTDVRNASISCASHHHTACCDSRQHQERAACPPRRCRRQYRVAVAP
jgi:hypothetical protein